MCGITGIYATSPAGRQKLERIDGATQALYKRGPDGGSVFRSEKAALGHRRLSIIDVSCAGDQPMYSLDGRYVIVFNGEIFNYKELTSRFLSEEERNSLRSTSDTEVFLLLYARLGEKAFPLLRGFFAAAIYDQVLGEMIIVRDRYGKKPILYYQDDQGLFFASEMKALLQMGIPKKINWGLLPIYFQLNYVPQPYSLIEGVRKLEPGHYIKITRLGQFSQAAYYHLHISRTDYGVLDYSEAKHKLVDLMDEAVRLRLISDVPLGAFLSGGIDSSVVVALASRHTNKLNTFSIGYKDNPFFDETEYANLVAKKFQTNHTVFSLKNDDFLEHLDDVLKYIDEPFADSSALPVFILSHYTRKHVTVALSGDGGDEVFAGYNKHAAEWRARKGGIKAMLVKAGYPLWSNLPQSRNTAIGNKIRQLNRFAKGAKLSAAERYWQWATFLNQKQAFSLLSEQTIRKVDGNLQKEIYDRYTKDILGKDFNEVLLADMNLVLLSDMLPKVDMMSMANSLEVRSPFLDQEVVDFAFGLPAEYKVDGSMKKKIVQDAFRRMLPPELYNRPKHGFEIPLLGWLKKELWNLIDKDLLEDTFVADQNIFDVSAIRDLKTRLHSTNPGDSHATIWALVVFQHWWKRTFLQ